VGWGVAEGLGVRAWRWDAAAGMSDIGSLDGGDASALAVNDHDQIAGFATTASASCGFLTYHAFRSTSGGLQDLGTLPGEEYSYAAAINNHGDVVGNSGIASFRAFLYRNGRMRDLTELAADPGWVLQFATGINDAGQITGIGFHHGQQRAFLFERRPEESKAKMRQLITLQ
jgi:probable HAF family extracellular repeat protein